MGSFGKLNCGSSGFCSFSDEVQIIPELSPDELEERLDFFVSTGSCSISCGSLSSMLTFSQIAN